MAFFTMAGSSLANLFKKPATLLYPVEKRAFFQTTRGHVEIAIETCIYCGLCAKKCPTSAIQVQREAKTWEIDRLKCIACGNCCEACPKQCLSMDNAYSQPVTAMEKAHTREVAKGA